MDISLGANSYIEMFTTLLGWLLYDRIYDILSDTGLFLLPFLALFFKGFFGVVLDNSEYQSEDTVKQSMMTVELNLILMFVVALFAFVPIMKVSLSGINYYRPNLECDIISGVAVKSPSQQVSAQNSGTTYSTTFSSLSVWEAKVPLWWSIVLSISTGITSSAVESIPCTLDYRRVSVQIYNDRIKDEGLIERFINFYQDCYLPAHAQRIQDQHNGVAPSSSMLVNSKNYSWMGGRYLVEYYYPNIVPQAPNPDFHYDPNVNPADAQYTDYGNGGHPTCQVVWAHPTKGLRQRVLDGMPAESLSWYDKFKSNFASDEVMDDQLVEDAISFSQLHDISATGRLTGSNGLKGAVSDAGAVVESWIGLGPKILAFRESAPYIQSLILMAIYISLPLLLVIGSYSVRVVLIVSLAIFALKFCTFWRALSFMIENKIYESSLLPGTFFNNSSPLDGAAGGNVFDLVTLSTYILFPVLWFGIVSWAGLSIAAVAGSAASGPAVQASQAGVDTVGGAVKAVVTKKVGGKGK